MLPKLGRAFGGGKADRNGGGAMPLSVVGADVRIVGNIITQGEMRIDGQVEGDISCRRLLVGQGARLNGEVSAETVEIHGELNGRITASVVIIAKTARILGDVIQDSVEIEAGASIEGRLIRKAPESSPSESVATELKALEQLPPAKGNGGHEPAQLAPPPTPSLDQEAAGTA